MSSLSPVVCLLECAGERLSNHVAWFGRALSRSATAKVLVFPWTAVRIENETPTLHGQAWEFRQGRLQRIENAEAIVPDVLAYRWKVPPPRVGDRPDELDALAHWAAMGINSPPNLNTLIGQILLRASERGVVTTAPGWDGEWDAKDSFELLLRSYQIATGVVVPRMPTTCVSREELAAVVEKHTKQGSMCVLKPTEGVAGEGIVIAVPTHPMPDLPELRYVVQPLLQSPLLIDGRKVDIRCHLMLDADEPDASRLVAPVLLRRGAMEWTPGGHAAEVLNSHVPSPDGERPWLVPLGLMKNIPESTRLKIRESVATAMALFVSAYSWRARTRNRRRVPNRLLLWGVDVLLESSGEAINSYISEVNVFPQLFREMPEADSATVEMLGGPYIEALMGKAASRRAAGVPAAGT